MNKCVDHDAPKANCCICDKIVDTCERETSVNDSYLCPEHPEGNEIVEGVWVCSEQCEEEYNAKHSSMNIFGCEVKDGVWVCKEKRDTQNSSMNILSIWDKCCACENISDEELDYAIGFLRDLEEKLDKLGPTFLLPRKEVCRMLNLFESFEFARKGMKDL